MSPIRVLAASLALGAIVSPQAVSARPTRPDTLTMVSTGTIARGEDNLDLFGGGNLAGLSYTNTYNLTFTYPGYKTSGGPGGYINYLNSIGMDTVQINGHTLVITGELHAYNSSFWSTGQPGFDERGVSVVGSNPGFSSIGGQELVDRIPSQWLGDPTATYLFQNSTVMSSGQQRNSSYLIAQMGSGPNFMETYVYFDVSSISSTYTTTFIPEPASWTTMLVGIALTGWLMRRRRSLAGEAV